MSKYKLNNEEKELLNQIEDGDFLDIENQVEEIQRFEQIADYNLNKRKSINIRPLEVDLIKVRTKAAKEGIPYQTLINSVIHKFANDQLIMK